MLTSDAIRCLRELRLPEVISIVESQNAIDECKSMDFDQRLSMVIRDLYSEKNGVRIQKLIKFARFRAAATFTGIMFIEERRIDRNLLVELATTNFTRAARNVAVYGATGSGKTYIACALGNSACRLGKRTRYIRLPDLFSDFAILDDEAARRKFLNKMSNYDLLVIDEWLKDVPTEDQVSFLFELVERRSETRSTVICSQFAPSDWYVRMIASVKTEAILDRLIHGIIKVDCGAYNMREYIARQSPVF
jgi:DNA replication protein DnaC